jgi:copper chaperone CopZ
MRLPGFAGKRFDQMIQYIHHVPGRLRVKSAAVKASEANARRAKECLEGVEGVHAVEANVVTGSVTVHYNARLVSGEALLSEFRGLELAPEATLQGGAFVHRGGAGATALAENVANRVVGKIAETLIERSAIALIGAII